MYVDAPPAGDWRAHNLIDKYKASGDNSTDPSLPFGWNGTALIFLLTAFSSNL